MPGIREIVEALAPRRLEPDVAEYLASLAVQLEQNPLLGFEPHAAQVDFIAARTPVVAAFAGNRFGKSTVGGVCALREALPADVLPEVLRSSKRFEGPTAGWIMLPTEDKIEDSFRPVFEKWTPPSEFLGGSWGKAYKGDSHVLRFKNGSTVGFKTYKQDPSTLGGAALHYVLYDEPPPKKHREEGMMRLADHGGFELFAMTPLQSNTGYVRREIWKRRESPDITVVKGSIYDNKTLDRKTVDRVLGNLTDVWRQAREFGDFVNVGGMMYPDWERCVEDRPFDLEFIRGLRDVVVGIDPGIRNAGFAWVAFDEDLTAYVFHEGLLQNKEVPDYAAFIQAENRRLGLREADIEYVCDPQQRERGKVNATTVKTALNQHGIYAADGQNNHEAGFDQMRSRMRAGRFVVSPTCVGLRDEADDYAAREPEENEDDSHLDPVSNRFHRMDALRYAVMHRFWDPSFDDEPAGRTLGWVPGTAPAQGLFVPQREYGPMGSMS